MQNNRDLIRDNFRFEMVTCEGMILAKIHDINFTFGDIAFELRWLRIEKLDRRAVIDTVIVTL